MDDTSTRSQPGCNNAPTQSIEAIISRLDKAIIRYRKAITRADHFLQLSRAARIKQVQDRKQQNNHDKDAG